MVPLLKGEIKHSWGFQKHRERLDENESLRITNIKFETREGSVKEELEKLRTSKKRVKVNFGRVNKDKKVIVRKIVRASSRGVGEVKKKG